MKYQRINNENNGKSKAAMACEHEMKMKIENQQ
jgi:hypothetical protein